MWMNENGFVMVGPLACPHRPCIKFLSVTSQFWDVASFPRPVAPTQLQVSSTLTIGVTVGILPTLSLSFSYRGLSPHRLIAMPGVPNPVNLTASYLANLATLSARHVSGGVYVTFSTSKFTLWHTRDGRWISRLPGVLPFGRGWPGRLHPPNWELLTLLIVASDAIHRFILGPHAPSA